jgi:hypothetical protein
MKRKKTDWSRVAWTPFVQVPIPNEAEYLGQGPLAIVVNSRYQVAIFDSGEIAPFGHVMHLSVKTHDKAPRHDWRDLQRIKNELAGEAFDAVEVYPAESKLVDTSNQYHLFVFSAYRLPFGFQERLVSEGEWKGSRQRPFEARPADCIGDTGFQALFDRARDAAISVRGADTPAPDLPRMVIDEMEEAQ